MMKAKELMVPIKVALKPDSTMKDALLAFHSTKLTGIPVNNRSGQLIGMYTRDNLDNCLLQGTHLDTSIEKYYLRDIMYFREDITLNNLTELIRWLRNSRIGQTPVVDFYGRPVGIINHAYALNHLLNHIEFSYKELSNIFQQAPCGLVAIDEWGIINLVSLYLNRLFPNIQVGGHIQELLPCLPFEEIITGVWTDPCKVKFLSVDLIVNGLPIIKSGKIKGAILILQNAMEIETSKYSIKNKEFMKLKYNNELFKLNGTNYTIDCFIGDSVSMAKIKSQALQASTSSSTVLICGESGTGKELLAQSIHNASDRFKRPFIKVDCAAILADLAEAELFGYEGGAFTGALRQGKPGKFELADGGTIFLDEIGNMPLSLQGRLLRVIQEKEIERVGGTRTKKIDVRIIAATNRDLYKLTEEGRFRKELYYRIKVLDVTIPPLRKHIKDIPLLLNYFLSKSNKKFGKQINGVTEEVMAFLKNYHWPGNIRELENIIERAVSCCHHDLIKIDALGINSWVQNNKLEHLVLAETTKELAKEADKKAIVNALKITSGNKSRAAKLLGISRTTLYDKLKPQLAQQ